VTRRCTHYKSSESYPRHIYLDNECAVEILDFIEDAKNSKKFEYIIGRILEQKLIYYDDYVRLTQYDHISEMRIFPNGMNARIYCKEISRPDGHFYVVAAKLLLKKTSEKINKTIDQIIKPIELYEYEFEGNTE
jgi:hypothetical protein